MTRSVLTCFLLFIIFTGFCQSQNSFSPQDGFLFPGEADRSDKYPLDPNSGRTTKRPSTATVPTPTTTSAASESAYAQCIARCRSTSEYNPLCGTDNTQYSNPGRLSCAKACGRNVEIRNYGSCNTDGVRG